MRQFIHNTGPFVAVFDGDKATWVERETNKITYPCLCEIIHFERCKDYKELDPKDFVGLEELAKAGYNVPKKEIKLFENGFCVNVVSEQAGKILADLAFNLGMKLNSVALYYWTPNFPYFSCTGNYWRSQKKEDVYGFYSSNCGSNPDVSFEEAVATLLKLQKPVTPLSKSQMVNLSNSGSAYVNFESKKIGLGLNDSYLSFEDFEKIASVMGFTKVN